MFELILTMFKSSVIFRGNWEVVLIGLRLKWNHHKQIDPLLQCVTDLD